MKPDRTIRADIADVFTPPVGIIEFFRAHIAHARRQYPP